MGAEMLIPDEAEEFRFYCDCGQDDCGRMGFQVEGVHHIVAAELERLVEETDWAWAVGSALKARASELRGEV